MLGREKDVSALNMNEREREIKIKDYDFIML